jgi:epoxide hydrolase 4
MTKLNLKPLIIFLLLFYIFANPAHSQAIQKSKQNNNITHEYINVNGVNPHYAKAGNGKKLIMFVHGFPEFWYQYRNQLKEFSKTDEYTVIAPDMRGYNLSSKPDSLEKYQIKYMVEDLRQLSEKLGYKKFTLVAHDWGGGIAWWFAITHPEYLDKLVIINMAHPATFHRELTHNPEQQKASSYIALFRTPDYEQTLSANNYEMLVNVVIGDDLKARNFTEADKEEYLKAWSQPGALTAGLNYYRANESYYQVPGLETHSHRVDIPTLVIWGEKDQALMKSNLDGLEDYIPDLTIKRIPEGSHWVIHEYPELVNKYIKEFIK